MEPKDNGVVYNSVSTVIPDPIKMHITLVFNWAISFGNFEHGRLWLEHDSAAQVPNNEPHEVILSDGSKALGYLVETKHKMTKFDPKTKHAVEQWSGNEMQHHRLHHPWVLVSFLGRKGMFFEAVVFLSVEVKGHKRGRGSMR